MRFFSRASCVLLPIALLCVSSNESIFGKSDTAEVLENIPQELQEKIEENQRERNADLPESAIPTENTAATENAVDTEPAVQTETLAQETAATPITTALAIKRTNAMSAEREGEFKKLFYEKLKAFGAFFGPCAHVFVLLSVPFSIFMGLLKAFLKGKIEDGGIKTFFGHTFFTSVAFILYLVYHYYYYLQDKAANAKLTERLVIPEVIKEDTFAFIEGKKYFKPVNAVKPMSNKLFYFAMALMGFLTGQFMNIVMFILSFIAEYLNNESHFKEDMKLFKTDKFKFFTNKGDFKYLDLTVAIILFTTLSYPFYYILKRSLDSNKPHYALPKEELEIL